MIDNEIMETGADNSTVNKWAPVLEGIEDHYTQRVTAQLLENQAKQIVSERVDEAETTTQSMGTFQKFAFPLVRRVFPELIANKICGVQPMSGPVSQVFYLGSDRNNNTTDGDRQTLYSKYNLTYMGLEASSIGGMTATIDTPHTPAEGFGNTASGSYDLSDMSLATGEAGAADGTYGGQIADFPNRASMSTWGFSMSAGELLSGSGIPDMTFHIEQQPVVARTRKLRALWTLEASQDLKAYHNLDLERELTELLSSELRLEIDRELIEDLRMIAYDVTSTEGPFVRANLDWGNSNDITNASLADSDFGTFQNNPSLPGTNPAGTTRNVFLMDFGASALNFTPRHVGDAYANLLALINIASQDIYTSTQRGPGNWLLTSPMVASLLESSARLVGGIERSDGPTNFGKNGVSYVGKFMGRYDLYVDPLYPEDEILMGYKGSSPMDAGYVYAPYIPLQGLPKVVDPATFQPRKGLITRYGKAAITPESRFYRIIRFAGQTNVFADWATRATNVNSGDVSP
tara:strand:+ start:22 stop:1575 length:1554 start_codon:yes stop_codon:yes gene_type:complete